MAAKSELERITTLETNYQHVATRADISDVRTEIANLRGVI